MSKVNLTRPKTGSFSKNPSTGKVLFYEHVPGHVGDLVKNHHYCSGTYAYNPPFKHFMVPPHLTLPKPKSGFLKNERSHHRHDLVPRIVGK